MADIRVKQKFIKVVNADGSIAVNQYFESARIETNQATTEGKTIMAGFTIPITCMK